MDPHSAAVDDGAEQPAADGVVGESAAGAAQPMDPLHLAGALLVNASNTLRSRAGAANTIDRGIALGQALATYALADATRRIYEALTEARQPGVHQQASGIVVPMVGRR